MNTQKSYVYIMSLMQKDKFKIGKADHIGNRYEQLTRSSGYAFDLEDSYAVEMPNKRMALNLEKMLHFQFEKYKRPEEPKLDGSTEFYMYECKEEVLNAIRKYCDMNPEVVLSYPIQLYAHKEKSAKVKMSRQSLLEQKAIQKEKTNSVKLRLLRRLIQRYGHNAKAWIKSEYQPITEYEINIEGMSSNEKEYDLLVKKIKQYFLDWDICRPTGFTRLENENKTTVTMHCDNRCNLYKNEIDKLLNT